MALKTKITKAEFDKLNDVLKSEYIEKDGSYVLDTDGASELERAYDRVKLSEKAAKERAEAAEQKLKELNDGKAADEFNDAKSKGKIDLLEKSWNEKYASLEKTFTEKLTAKEAYIKKVLIDNKALEIASEISKSPALILPHIKARLAADFDGQEPTTRVLDNTGKVTALTIDDLKKEFVENKDFSAIIVGSKASGGNAAHDSKSFQNSNAGVEGGTAKTLAQSTPKEVAEKMRSIVEAKAS